MFTNTTPGHPYRNAMAVEPSVDPLVAATQAVYIGGEGNLSVMMSGKHPVVIKNISGWLYIDCTHIYPDTTATDIVIFW